MVQNYCDNCKDSFGERRMYIRDERKNYQFVPIGIVCRTCGRVTFDTEFQEKVNQCTHSRERIQLGDKINASE